VMPSSPENPPAPPVACSGAVNEWPERARMTTEMRSRPPASRQNSTTAVRTEVTMPRRMTGSVPAITIRLITSHQMFGRPAAVCSHEPRNTTTAAIVTGADSRLR
jgi:hypothetical protein